MLNVERCRRKPLFVLVTLALISFSATTGLIAQEPGRAGVASAIEARRWSDALSLALEGQFARAHDRLAPLVAASPSAERIQGWLDEYLDQQAERAKLTHEDFVKYVGYSKDAAKRGKIRVALEWANAALANCEDRDAFLDEPWLKDHVSTAMRTAAEHREKGEWREAATLYDRLASLYERDTEYKHLRDDCLTQFRLEFVYRKDNNWEDYLQGIVPRMVEDALFYLDSQYVEVVDFKALTLSALDQILLLARTPGLKEVFPSLADEQDRREFELRIQRRRDQIASLRKVRRQDAVDEFSKVLEINQKSLRFPEALISSEFTLGALETLDDFTSIFWPTELREFTKHTDGEFVGVGIQITKPLNEIVVATPLAGGPAYRAGIISGDVIYAVDGKSTEDISLTNAVQMITGPAGTSVQLSIRRHLPGGKTVEIDVPLVREEIRLETVLGIDRQSENEQEWRHMVDEDMGIGYLRLNNFSKTTVRDVRKAIDRMLANGMRALILDLRDDPGGLLTSANDIAELFLAKDQLIVRTEGLRSPPMELRGESNQEYENIPLTLLINDGSASASEIVAGALKDHGRALLVGSRTFGKFSVQNLQPLFGAEAALKFTTAWYYLPSGKNLHRKEGSETWGVEPDVLLELVPKERYRLYEMFRSAERLGPAAPDLIASARDEEAAADDPPEEKSSNPDIANAVQEHETVASAEVTADDALTAPKADADDDADAQDEDDVIYEDENNRPFDDPQFDTALLLTRIKLLSLKPPTMALSMEREGNPARSTAN